MRRQHHDIRATHDPHLRARPDAPIKRSYERVTKGERTPSDDLVDESLPVEPVDPGALDHVPPASAARTPAALDAEVDQELAWVSGSSPAKYEAPKQEKPDDAKEQAGKHR